MLVASEVAVLERYSVRLFNHCVVGPNCVILRVAIRSVGGALKTRVDTDNTLEPDPG